MLSGYLLQEFNEFWHVIRAQNEQIVGPDAQDEEERQDINNRKALEAHQSEHCHLLP